MRFDFRGGVALFTVGGVVALASVTASAQSLGGFGPASSYANPGVGGGGGPVLMPYGGTFEGFMPSRAGGGGGSSLSFRSRPSAAMAGGRTSFSLSPLSSEMGRNRGVRPAPPFGAPGEMRLGGGPRLRPPGLGGSGVMPPSLGYPFRQPPSLVPDSAPGAGM